MKNFTLLLFSVFVFGLSASGQIKINKLFKAGGDLINAFTLSDDAVAEMSRRAVSALDSMNKVDTAAYAIRLDSVTQNLSIDGMTLNFKVYQRDEVNAFACGDGSVRIYSGLMDVMTNDELVAIIGHEIGHVARNDAKNSLKNAYLKSAAESAAGSVSKGVAAQLSQSQLMELTHALASAQYSQQQEYAADEFGFEFCVRHGIDPYAMYNALTKLSQLSKKPGAHTSTLLQAFSTHPDSDKRAEKMKAKADELQH